LFKITPDAQAIQHRLSVAFQLGGSNAKTVAFFSKACSISGTPSNT
jgi:hypothetical protein